MSRQVRINTLRGYMFLIDRVGNYIYTCTAWYVKRLLLLLLVLGALIVYLVSIGRTCIARMFPPPLDEFTASRRRHRRRSRHRRTRRRSRTRRRPTHTHPDQGPIRSILYSPA